MVGDKAAGGALIWKTIEETCDFSNQAHMPTPPEEVVIKDVEKLVLPEFIEEKDESLVEKNQNWE